MAAAGATGAACAWLLTGIACGDARPPGDAEAAPQAAAEEQARVAPEFTLESLNGGVVRLADLRGKTVIIDFWATWCPPCEFQVPELNAFWEAHREDGDVAVLGISVDVEGPEVVQAWAEEKDVRYEVLVGGEDLARRFGALGFPTLYVVTPDGRVDSEHVGLIEVADLELALERQRGGSDAPEPDPATGG